MTKFSPEDNAILTEIKAAEAIDLASEVALAESTGRKPSKATVLARSRARTAILIAKASNDANYAKYRAAVLQVKELRATLISRYGAKAKAALK